MNPPAGPIIAGRGFTITAAVTGGDATWEFSNGTGPTAGGNVPHTFTDSGRKGPRSRSATPVAAWQRRPDQDHGAAAVPGGDVHHAGGGAGHGDLHEHLDSRGAYNLVEWDFGDGSDPVRGPTR